MFAKLVTAKIQKAVSFPGMKSVDPILRKDIQNAQTQLKQIATAAISAPINSHIDSPIFSPFLLITIFEIRNSFICLYF